MQVSLKYAVVERERRFIVARLPDGVSSTKEIHDRYVLGTRLRLREVRTSDGSVTRKLAQKIRLTDGPGEVACTNLYLDNAEWAALIAMPARSLTKTRHMVHRDGFLVAIDEHENGTLVAEIDDGDEPTGAVPDWLEVVADVSQNESWTGVNLAY
ncbi:hypothetical protein [Solicola sp. PLA-1-18]|uniref:hypothetical protein n=1 Tax=Solicola sp. PLA-1-18 TaxID=3380532 RepID=UPI003B7DEE79